MNIKKTDSGFTFLRSKKVKLELKSFLSLAKINSGFTLMEVLVTLTIIVVVGLILSGILSKGFESNTKTALIGTIKQNGQVSLNIISQTLRSAESIVCSAADTLVARTQNGTYVRFTFIPPTVSTNGYIRQDYPVLADARVTDNLCTATVASAVDLTDKTSTGISVKDGRITRESNSGFKDLITIEFSIGPSVTALKSFENQIDAVPFKTTIQVR